MARSRFVISDTHFTEPGMCAFAGPDGVAPLRPWGRVVPNWKQMSAEERADLMPEFQQRAAEMDEAMVDRWNAQVPATGATVYHLGDVTKRWQDLTILGRLNGKKKLIKGNHDPYKVQTYTPYFYDVQAYRIGDDIIMSHIPIHEESLNQRWMANVHGHLHADRVRQRLSRNKVGFDGYRDRLMDEWVDHPRYLCVSVEQVDYAPLPCEEMMERIREQQT